MVYNMVWLTLLLNGFPPFSYHAVGSGGEIYSKLSENTPGALLSWWCTGNESNLLECPRREGLGPNRQTGCSGGLLAGVRCSGRFHTMKWNELRKYWSPQKCLKSYQVLQVGVATIPLKLGEILRGLYSAFYQQTATFHRIPISQSIKWQREMNWSYCVRIL